MNIIFLNCDNKAKLFSFHRHDFKQITIDDKYYMLDGGFDYQRFSGGIIEEKPVKELIKDIRESFIWGKNYDKENKKLPKIEYALLKDLNSSHICGILSYFTDRLNDQEINVIIKPTKEWLIIHDIFIQELNYRLTNGII